MLVASGLYVAIAAVGAILCGGGAFLYVRKQRAGRIAPWKLLRNGMTTQEIRSLLGQPRKVIPTDGGENWDYGARPYEATVQFTDGRVTGFIKPF